MNYSQIKNYLKPLQSVALAAAMLTGCNGFKSIHEHTPEIEKSELEEKLGEFTKGKLLKSIVLDSGTNLEVYAREDNESYSLTKNVNYIFKLENGSIYITQLDDNGSISESKTANGYLRDLEKEEAGVMATKLRRAKRKLMESELESLNLIDGEEDEYKVKKPETPEEPKISEEPKPEEPSEPEPSEPDVPRLD